MKLNLVRTFSLSLNILKIFLQIQIKHIYMMINWFCGSASSQSVPWFVPLPNVRQTMSNERKLSIAQLSVTPLQSSSPPVHLILRISTPNRLVVASSEG